MKTYKQFVAEAAPLLAAPMIMKGVGAGLAATGLAGMIMQARKQGEGKRAQPVDYGQEGDTAKPRTRNVQRPVRRRSNKSYTEQERLRRREERAAERSAQGSDTQHGPSFKKDAAEAAKRREQNISQKPLTPDQRLDRLIGKAAKNLGIKLPEENKHRDAKLFGQYKMLQNPPKPEDPLKAIKLKKV